MRHGSETLAADDGLMARVSRDCYTIFSFHRPRRNSTALTTAIVEYAMAIDQNTPDGPKPQMCASMYAIGSSHNQKQNRLMTVGVTCRRRR